MTRLKINGRAAETYGKREIDAKFPSKYAGSKGTNVLSYTFSYDDLPTSGVDALIQSIPANAYIKSVSFKVLEAFAGGTSYLIGLEDSAGATLDADGISGPAILTAELDAVGKSAVCSGAYVGLLVGIGAVAGQLDVVATGTFTAGKGVIEIEYQELLDRA